MPTYFLEQAGVRPEDFAGESGYSGSHDKTIDLLEAGTFEAGVLNEQVWDARVEAGTVDESRVPATPLTGGGGAAGRHCRRRRQVYNLAILGRLMAEVVENLDRRPADALRALGARSPHVFVYGILPQAGARFSAYALYRWEVALRETVIVGVVGAAGLGRLLGERLAAFDHGAVLTVVLALIALSILVDVLSAGFRRSLR